MRRSICCPRLSWRHVSWAVPALAPTGTGQPVSLAAGHLESSNVDTGTEMVGLIREQRGYALATSVYKTQEQTLDDLKALGRLR